MEKNDLLDGKLKEELARFTHFVSTQENKDYFDEMLDAKSRFCILCNCTFKLINQRYAAVTNFRKSCWYKNTTTCKIQNFHVIE